MTLQALCDLFPLSAPALALSLLPSLPITLQVPGSRSYSRLPEPPSCHSSLAFSTCNCVFQKWHSLPLPFQVSRLSPSITSSRKPPQTFPDLFCSISCFFVFCHVREACQFLCLSACCFFCVECSVLLSCLASTHLTLILTSTSQLLQ